MCVDHKIVKNQMRARKNMKHNPLTLQVTKCFFLKNQNQPTGTCTVCVLNQFVAEMIERYISRSKFSAIDDWPPTRYWSVVRNVSCRSETSGWPSTVTLTRPVLVSLPDSTSTYTWCHRPSVNVSSADSASPAARHPCRVTSQSSYRYERTIERTIHVNVYTCD